MHAATRQIRNVCFFALVLVFALLVAFFTLGGRRMGLPFAVLVALASAFALVALVLVVLTLRVKERGMQRISFLLVGASALGMPLAAVLHNVVYGLFIWWFGEGFWERHGMPDEPVFFFLAIMVCPALFVVGSMASIVLLIKTNKKERGTQLFSDN